MADASSLLEYLLLTEHGRQVGAIIEDADVDLWAPALCDVEVAAGIRRSLVRGLLSKSRAAESIDDYLDLPLMRSGHQALLPRMLDLRGNFTVYDALYVALAELLGAELLTADRRFARAIRAHTRVSILP